MQNEVKGEVKNNGIPLGQLLVARNGVTMTQEDNLGLTKVVRVTVEDIENFHRAFQKAEQLEFQVEMWERRANESENRLRTLEAKVDTVLAMRH